MKLGFEFIVYPELFSLGDRDYILEMIEREATLVEEVTSPILTKGTIIPLQRKQVKQDFPTSKKDIIFELIPFYFYPNEILLSYNNETYSFQKHKQDRF